MTNVQKINFSDLIEMIPSIDTSVIKTVFLEVDKSDTWQHTEANDINIVIGDIKYIVTIKDINMLLHDIIPCFINNKIDVTNGIVTVAYSDRY